MNRTLKLILGLLFGAVLICTLIGVIGLTLFGSTVVALLSNVQAQPGEADRVAENIANFALPEGYSGAVATQFAGFDLVGYDGPDGHSHLYLFQLPPRWHADWAELERQFQSSVEGQGDDYGPDMEVIAQEPVTIRGLATTLVVSEGTNGQGELIRSASAAFQGKGGQALLSFSGPAATWDPAMIEAFINSMR
jgi:hypothetical protein